MAAPGQGALVVFLHFTSVIGVCEHEQASVVPRVRGLVGMFFKMNFGHPEELGGSSLTSCGCCGWQGAGGHEGEKFPAAEEKETGK